MNDSDRSNEWLLRTNVGVIITSHADTLLLDRYSKSFCLSLHQNLLLTVLGKAEQPICRAQLRHDVDATEVVFDQLLAFLIENGWLISGSKEEITSFQLTFLPRETTPVLKSLLVVVSGALNAASMLPFLLSFQRLVEEPINVILSEPAGKFLSVKALKAFGLHVWTKLDETHTNGLPLHTYLSEQSDAIIVAPASAHTISRLATGSCSDLISLTVAVTQNKPIIIVPSMNPAMLAYGPIKDNLRCLKDLGMYIVLPGLGAIASKAMRQSAFSGMGMSEASIRGLFSIVSAHYVARGSNGQQSPRDLGRVH